MDNQSIAHTKYNCTYHFGFIPKYLRKVTYGKLETAEKTLDGREGRSNQRYFEAF